MVLALGLLPDNMLMLIQAMAHKDGGLFTKALAAESKIQMVMTMVAVPELQLLIKVAVSAALESYGAAENDSLTAGLFNTG